MKFRITDQATNAAIAGALVNVSSGGHVSTLGPTDDNGYSSPITLPVGAAYSMSAAKTDYQTRSVSSTVPNWSPTATYILTFPLVASLTTTPPPTTYTTNGSLGTTGATVSISGGGSCSVSSSSYTCSNIPNGGNVDITPSKAGGTFSPTFLRRTGVTSNSTYNFTFTANTTATPVKVRVRNAATLANLSGVAVRFRQGGSLVPGGQVTTDSTGFTPCTLVPSNIITTVDLLKTGYTSRLGISIATSAGSGCLDKGTYNLTLNP